MPPDHALFDRRLLTERRTRVAARAAEHDFLLRSVADDLLDRLALVRRPFPRAAILGTHHGILGPRLRARPGTECVIETDNVSGPSAGPTTVIADEEWLPLAPESLDLIVAPLSLQTVNDLPGTFSQVHQALKPDGLFLAAIVGGNTLTELRQSLIEAESETASGASPRIHPAVEVRSLGHLLQRTGFALPVVDSDTLNVTYPSPIALMHDLRGMGATNVLIERSRNPLRRTTLLRACEIYIERFANPDGRIRATFEIITLTAWTPHESQQKPLRPGSAKTRLAVALQRPKSRSDDKQ